MAGPKHRFALLVVVLAMAILFLIATAAGTESPQEQYRQVQKDLRTQKKKLESVKKTERSVLDEIGRTTADLNETRNLLNLQRGKIQNIKSAAASIERDIVRYKEDAQRQAAILQKRLRSLERLSRERDAILILVSGEETPQTLRVARYLRDLSAHDYALIVKYKATITALGEKQEEFKKMLANLQVEESRLTSIHGSLADKKKEREAILASVRKERSAYEKMVVELKDSATRLSRLLQESERREQELRKRKGSRTVPPSEMPVEDSGFARLKGTLPWPVRGNIAVPYGSQVDPQFNLPVFRSGIHIRAPENAQVRAIHEGKIVFADTFKGYGQLVIINHGGGYHSLYGNLAKIFPQSGGIIKENQSLGEAGESAALGATGLYFELRYKGRPLDPQQWLKK